MIVDVLEEQFFKIKGAGVPFFYTEDDKGVSMFFPGNGFVLRSFHKRPASTVNSDDDYARYWGLLPDSEDDSGDDDGADARGEQSSEENDEEDDDYDDEEEMISEEPSVSLEDYLLWKQINLIDGIRALRVVLKNKVEVEYRASSD